MHAMLGTGIWAIDFAQQHPKSEVLGIDLNPIEPELPVPPNCRFECGDAQNEWTFAEGKSFDYIHVRSLGLMMDHHLLLKPVYDHLTPGGWAEFQEWNMKFESADRSLEGTQLYRWNCLVRKAIQQLGGDTARIMSYKHILPKIGFEEITERKYAVPLTPWAPGKQSKAMGQMNKTNILASMRPMSMAILTKVPGWSISAVEDLLTAARKDLDNAQIHGFMTL
ncbi:hypothetical protein DL769_010759 [Monosporascus sp. CRB-8-3]|nr:hypothetical protein DL769_010759 [Monosporascus sp. CRB-8-3]